MLAALRRTSVHRRRATGAPRTTLAALATRSGRAARTGARLAAKLRGHEILELRPLLTIQMRPNRQHVGGDAVVDGHVGLPERIELLGQLLFGGVVGLEQIGQFQLLNLQPALKLSHVLMKGLALGSDDFGGLALQPQPPD